MCLHYAGNRHGRADGETGHRRRLRNQSWTVPLYGFRKGNGRRRPRRVCQVDFRCENRPTAGRPHDGGQCNGDARRTHVGESVGSDGAPDSRDGTSAPHNERSRYGGCGSRPRSCGTPVTGRSPANRHGSKASIVKKAGPGACLFTTITNYFNSKSQLWMSSSFTLRPMWLRYTCIPSLLQIQSGL